MHYASDEDNGSWHKVIISSTLSYCCSTSAIVYDLWYEIISLVECISKHVKNKTISSRILKGLVKIENGFPFNIEAESYFIIILRLVWFVEF